MLFRSFLFASVCLLSPLAAQARQAPPAGETCAALDADLPAEFSAWTAKAPLTAASRVGDIGQAGLKPGQAYLATMPERPSVAYVVPSGKSGDPGSHGGLFDLTIATAGTYVVVLGAGAWVDVLHDGAPVASVSHSHGPACSTLRKMVAFELRPGRHVVQIDGAAPAALPIMVVRRP